LSGLNSDTVSGIPKSDLFADGLYNAGEFMSHNHGRCAASRKAQISVNIGTAYPNCFYGDFHILGAQCYIRSILPDQLSGAVIYQSFHLLFTLSAGKGLLFEVPDVLLKSAIILKSPWLEKIAASLCN